jgi:IclR family KDG regulon transcriptional repressor
MENGKASVRAVERALDILLCFTDSTDLGLTEIAKRVNLHKSTVFRILASLENKGFINRNAETDKYRLGFRIWELSASLNQSDDPFAILLPEMERLRDILGETISLYIREGKERIRVQAVQSMQTVRRFAAIGQRMPLSVGASSKVLVAYAGEELLEMVLNDPEWPSNINKEQYIQQIKQIHTLGYATSVEEREPGVSAISAPIFNRSGQIFAALAVSGPVNRLTQEKMKEIAPQVLEAANRMGKMIK